VPPAISVRKFGDESRMLSHGFSVCC